MTEIQLNCHCFKIESKLVLRSWNIGGVSVAITGRILGYQQTGLISADIS